MIFRFNYSEDIAATVLDSSKEWMLKNIAQVSPLVNKNKDVVAIFEMGWIGAYGEWFYTGAPGRDEFGNDGQVSKAQVKNRKEIVDAQLRQLDVDITLGIRIPVTYKKNLYEVGLPPVSASTPKDSPIARLGFFNDALLSTYGDEGFYVKVNSKDVPDPKEVDWIKNEALFVPIGGETDNYNLPRVKGVNAFKELQSLHYTYVNEDYQEQVVAGWKKDGTLAKLAIYLGYRFVLNSATYDTTTTGQWNYSLDITNVGFAPPFHPRDVSIVFKSGTKEYEYSTNWDVLFLGNRVIRQTLNISTLPAGKYKVLLSVKDQNPSIANRPEYSIRFANKNMWVKNTGDNDLGFEITKN